MKFIRKRHINEGYFKSVDDIKTDKENRKPYDANVLANDVTKILLKVRKGEIDKCMHLWFVSPDWWANSPVVSTCNLRPGTETMDDFLISSTNIYEQSDEEKIKYLYDKVNFSTRIENGKIIIEVPLRASDYPVNIICFHGNGLFTYLDNADKWMSRALKYPVKIKVRLEDAIVKASRRDRIEGMTITQRVNIQKLVKFFKERVVNFQDLNHPDFHLTIQNRIDDETLAPLFELGNYIKFNTIQFSITSTFISRRYHMPIFSLRFPEDAMPKLNDLDGIENLLKNPSTNKIRISSFYKRNPVFVENIEKLKNIVKEL